ncbi:UDP-2,3-diacylglucosamine pyrophosphatase [Planctomycetales bacterium 10988]|nr:UDP-2,3-diacylglucosamine pyrophosphatase [Planctomycetales bacterium 10988]
MENQKTLFKTTRVDTPQIGLIAGWGEFPIVIAEALVKQGRRVVCLGIRDHADPALQEICHEFTWIGMGRLNRSIAYLKRHGVRQATMAGKIWKFRLFEPWAWIHYLPDLRLTRLVLRLLKEGFRDDQILLAVIQEFAKDGISFEPATHFAPELLVKSGLLTRRKPNTAQERDIQYGWKIAKEMGRLDIGQSVIVRDGLVIAVEALEGTDRCIERAGELCKAGGFIMVKVAKPEQDMRFDVPTVGVQTLEKLANAGGKVLAIEADKTILLNQKEFINFADRHRLIVVALKAGQMEPISSFNTSSC